MNAIECDLGASVRFPVKIAPRDVTSIMYLSKRILKVGRSVKEGLYRIQILCRRHPFRSYPAGLTIADPPGKDIIIHPIIVFTLFVSFTNSPDIRSMMEQIKSINYCQRFWIIDLFLLPLRQSVVVSFWPCPIRFRACTFH